MYKTDELMKKFDFKSYQQKKEEEYYQKCEANRQKGLQLLRDSKKRDVLSPIVNKEKPTVIKKSTKPKRIPTVKDISEKMLNYIETIPKNRRKEATNRVLMGIMLKWEHEDAENS